MAARARLTTDDRHRDARRKLARVRQFLEADLPAVAEYLDELDRHEAWRYFRCGSMAELVAQSGLRLDERSLATIRARLGFPRQEGSS